MNYFNQKDLENLLSFKEKYRSFKDNDHHYDLFDKRDLWYLARGIIPYKKNQRTYSSYHGVLLVGYDDQEDVFILKDIRDKYFLKGMCKLPYQYIKDLLKGHSDLVKIVIGIEAEKIKD